jgi:hypothetical protein
MNPSIKPTVKYHTKSSLNLSNATFEISRSKLDPLFRIYFVFENTIERNVSQHLSAVKLKNTAGLST